MPGELSNARKELRGLLKPGMRRLHMVKERPLTASRGPTARAGGLLGARDGVDAIPADWLAVLQLADEFVAAAHQLSRA